VSHIRPEDLVNLTTTCQNINTQIRMNEAQVKANLLTKTLCPGLGLLERKKSHCPCKTRGWYIKEGCGGAGFDVASKPCAGCGINTCDECRIHVVYQVSMEDSGRDNRRWWAGYVLNCPTPFGLLPPKGADGDEWHLPPDLMRPRHDQGRFHTPLSVYAIADPEPLDRILDTNLGRRDITPWGRNTAPFDGNNVVGIFRSMTNSRKDLVCWNCAEARRLNNSTPCSCTLRKRFLDRWVCLPCFNEEVRREEPIEDPVVAVDVLGHLVKLDYCACGIMIPFDDDGYETRCNWCDGIVVNEPEDNDDDVDVIEVNAPNNEDEDDNAGVAPADAPADHPVPVDNKDGSLSIFYNGTRISGERLGRALVMGWLADKGVELPCQCCKCPCRVCDHHQNHNHNHNHDHHGDSNGEGGEAGNNSGERDPEESGEESEKSEDTEDTEDYRYLLDEDYGYMNDSTDNEGRSAGHEPDVWDKGDEYPSPDGSEDDD
jgi:hypothetical protein